MLALLAGLKEVGDITLIDVVEGPSTGKGTRLESSLTHCRLMHVSKGTNNMKEG